MSYVGKKTASRAQTLQLEMDGCRLTAEAIVRTAKTEEELQFGSTPDSAPPETTLSCCMQTHVA